jgi:malonate decarboxylase delta subunit
MERLSFEYPSSQTVLHRAHVGVVGSGDLEVLLEPSPDHLSRVTVCTSADGYSMTWKAVLDRFFLQYQGAVLLAINDFGATPGVVALRLREAVETGTP